MTALPLDLSAPVCRSLKISHSAINFLLIVTVIVLVATPLFGQYDPILDQGIMPFQSYAGGDMDSVNIGTGVLSLHIPLVSFPQRGGKLHLAYRIYFSNPIYVKSYCTNVHTYCTWVGVSPDHPTTVLVGQSGQASLSLWQCGTSCWTASVGGEDDSNHQMAWIDTTGGGGSTYGDFRAVDGSGYSASSTITTSTVKSPAGVVYTVTYNSSGSIINVTSTDPNGNQITSACPWCTIVDTMGRQIPSPSASATWTIPGPNGGNSTYQISGSAVTLPDLKSYKFEYTTITLPLLYAQTQPQTFTVLSKVTFPSGGSITYGYYNTAVPDPCGGGYQAYAPVISRSLDANDGKGPQTWTYNRSNSPIKEIDPLNNVTLHTGGVCNPYETQTQYEDSNGNVLKTVNTVYSSLGTTTQPVNVHPTSITTIWPNGQQRKVSMTYDRDHGTSFNYGLQNQSNGIAWMSPPGSGYTDNPWTVTETDYGQGAPGPTLRTTNTSYLAFSNSNYFNANLFDLISSVQIVDGGGTQQAYTTYAYDESKLVSSGVTKQHVAGEAYPGNQTSVHRWLSNGSAVSQTPCNVTVANGGYVVSNQVYFDTGIVQKSTDPCLYPTSYLYSSTYFGAYPTTLTNDLNQNIVLGYDFNTGQVTSIQDPNLQSTGKQYDIMGRLTHVSYPDGGQTTYCYTDLGGSTCTQASSPPYSLVTTKAVSSTLNETSTTLFDGLDRVVQTTLNSDPSGATYTQIVYDALGRKYQVYNPTRCFPPTTNCGTESTWGYTTNNYDPLGRITSVAEQDGSTVSTVYSSFPCTTVTDEAGKSRKSCSDGLGRLTGVWEDPAGLNYETDYSYNALSNLTSVTQKGSNSTTARIRTFHYDTLSHLTSSINPESGTISYGYDADGNLIAKTAPLPNLLSGAGTVTTKYSYDGLNRLIGKNYVGLTTPAATYFYDQTSYNGLTISNGIGRRTGMSDGSGAAAWNYDSMGRIAALRRTINGLTNTATYAYSPYVGGEVGNLTYFSGSQVAYTWSAADRELTATDPYPIYFVKGATYSPAGALTGAVFGSYATGFPGTTASNSYNNRLQPTVLSASSPTMTVLSLSYNFNQGTLSAPKNNGSIVSIQNNRDNNRTQAFTYDSLNRIASAQTPNSSLWGDTYVIDAWGNLTNKNQIAGKGGESLAMPALTNNQLSGMTYDVAGNVYNDGLGHTYVYDAESRLISAGGMSYFYDGDGNRVAKCTEGSTAGTCAAGATGTLYWRGKDGETINESDLPTSTWKRFVYFNGKIVSRRDSDTQKIYFFYSDHLGSMGVVTDQLGQTIENESDYYPYGGERVITSLLSDEHYKFTGKERDSESGLDNFEARYDASSLGRFMTPDPMGGHLENPQSLNKYAYVLNNPTSLTDPTGLDSYLLCGQTEDNASTCQSQTVGYDANGKAQTATVQGVTNADKSFTATQIGNDANGNLVDKTTGTGSYTASANGSGVQFSNNGGQTSSSGVFVNGTPQNTFQDAGFANGNTLSGFTFTLTNSKLEAGQTEAGSFTFAGTPDQAGAALQMAGFNPRSGENVGMNEYRSPGRFWTGANSSHFNVFQIGLKPWLSVPQAQGDMHFGEHNPYSPFGWVPHYSEANQ
jgi:RHS repeat-associated protein